MNTFSNLQKLILCLLLTVACTAFYSCRPTPQYPAALLQADSLTQSQADSAIRLLQELAPTMTRADEPVRRYYQLLTVKAQDKAFIPHTSDSLVLDLLHYYQEEGDPRLLPEACYYAGRVTRDLGDAPQALDYFHQALDATSQSDYQRNMQGQEHATLQLQGKIHAQMGYLFRRQHLYDEAIKAFEQGYREDSINGDTVGMIYSLCCLGDTYRQLKIYQKSLSNYILAEGFALNTDSIYLTDVSCQIAMLYNVIGEYNKAKEYMNKYSFKVSNRNVSRIYSIWGRIYSNTEELDKAAYYFHELLQSKDLYARLDANLWLGNHASHNGDDKEALRYIREYTLLLDSLNNLRNEEAVALSQSLYNYQLKEKEILHLQIKEYKHKFYVWMSFAIIGVLLFIVYKEHARRKKIKQQNELLQGIIAASKKDVEIKQMLAAKTYDDLKNHEVYLHIRQQCEEQVQIKPENWTEIENLLNDYFPDFIPKLRATHTYNDTEWKLSLLLKMGFSFSDIALLIGRTYIAIYASQNRLFKKLFPEGSDYENWSDFISSL